MSGRARPLPPCPWGSRLGDGLSMGWGMAGHGETVTFAQILRQLRGDLWAGGAIFLLYIGSSDTPLCFWLTLALERRFLQLSTIAIHNTATGRCIPPERTRATICMNIFWDHQWKLMRMHNKEIPSPFSSPFIYFTRLLLIEGWLCVLPSFQTRDTAEKKSCLKQFTFIREKIDNQVIKRW